MSMTIPTADLIAAAMVRAPDTVPEVLPPPNEMSDKLLLEVIARRLRDAEEKLARTNEALINVRQIIAEGAVTGFNYKDGDWAERLYLSQQKTSAALASKEPGT